MNITNCNTSAHEYDNCEWHDNDIINWHKSVLIHFEPNIYNGVVFLYQVEKNIFWQGNADCYLFFSKINGSSSLKQIISYISLDHNIKDADIWSKLKNVVSILFQKGFLCKDKSAN